LRKIVHRSEVDGLRAIAVLAVVLYHGGFGPRAGFVGVDIFFVISGYLITALLCKEWSTEGRIDLWAFYARRFRRLFAALVVVVAVTVIASICLLSPFGEQLQVARSAAASLLFAANFYFEATTGGYFDGNSNLLPLLHLWSLGVEEQFYLLWPMLLVVVLRLRPKSLTAVVAMLSIASLLLAEALVRVEPGAAFYQMPARFWELGVGGLIALRPPGRFGDGRPAAYAGVAMVLAAIFIPVAHFPGFGALPAVLGAGLLLFAVHGSEHLGLPGIWLRSRPMVFFGLISYSLYLWHWPLLALDRAMRVGQSPIAMPILLCLAAVVLATLSYHFVEKPFRRGDLRASNRRLVSVGVAASAALALFTVTLGDLLHRVPAPDDLASRSSRDMPANRVLCNYRGDESLAVFPKPDCSSMPDKPVRVAIWGDSHALAWQPFAWALARRAGVAATSYTRDACAPVLDYDNGKPLLEATRCREFNALVFNKVVGVDTLVVTALWPYQLAGNATAATDFAERMESTMRLVAPRVGRIIILGPTPYLPDSAPRCIRLKKLPACTVSRQEFDGKSAAARKFLMSLTAKYRNVEYVELADFFCNATSCPVLKDGYSLYWDSNHVSSTAARKFAGLYLDRVGRHAIK
jgi:peptidoglycan/LPS O-acetylase OafA/YrhL